MSQIRYWIEPRALKIVQADYFDRSGKIQRHFEGKLVRAPDGSWAYSKLSMHNFSDGLTTELRLLSRTTLKSYKPAVFQVDSLATVRYPHESMGKAATLSRLHAREPVWR